jgi:hypothetical protein
MPRRFFAVTLAAAICCLAPGIVTPAHAQEGSPSFQLDLTGALRPATLAADQSTPRPLPVFAPVSERRPSPVMLTLYASTAAMQALDMHSTLRAFSNGAVEANPLMSGVTRNKAAFLAVKAGVAASTIFAAKNMARRNKVAAIATLVAVNTAYALVVSHNYKVAGGRR